MSLRGRFEQQGFISAVDVLPPGKVDYYSEKCKQFVDSYRAHPDYAEWTYYRTELVLKWVSELAAEDSLLDAVEALIGPDILLWNAFLPAKAPRTDTYFGWHQDAARPI